MDAAQYLRKNRMEEGMDTEEVLAKHRKALAEFAARNNIHIIETYYEVVSGESLYARPEMLRLLKDVEDGCYDAVLCMDLDRLSCGRMRDQGVILDTFKDSGTLIITPEKTYGLSDELDDEMAEFKTFISRREYKIINKRLRRGLNESIQDGCYVANTPYGYKKTTIDGLHPAIVDKELYDQVQTIMAGRYRPSKQDGTVKSALAGLVRCANCGRNMQRLNMKGGAYLVCMKRGCCAI